MAWGRGSWPDPYFAPREPRGVPPSPTTWAWAARHAGHDHHAIAPSDQFDLRHHPPQTWISTGSIGDPRTRPVRRFGDRSHPVLRRCDEWSPERHDDPTTIPARGEGSESLPIRHQPWRLVGPSQAGGRSHQSATRNWGVQTYKESRRPHPCAPPWRAGCTQSSTVVA